MMLDPSMTPEFGSNADYGQVPAWALDGSRNSLFPPLTSVL